MLKLYGFKPSGNSYKPRLLLELLNVEYEWIDVDLANGGNQSPEYLAINPLGQVPTLVDGEIKLADAQAILFYIARYYGGNSWLPVDTLPLSKVVRWLSTTAGEVRQGLENARLYHFFGVTSINIERANQVAERILKHLDEHLRTRKWLEFERPTIADIAVFAYVNVAHEGKIDLAPYPSVIDWANRVKQLPGFIPM